MRGGNERGNQMNGRKKKGAEERRGKGRGRGRKSRLTLGCVQVSPCKPEVLFCRLACKILTEEGDGEVT